MARPIVFCPDCGLGALLVGPDKGVSSMAWASLGGAASAAAIEHERVCSPVSKTFHGRDVLAPAGAHLASGVPFDEMGAALEAESLRVVELPGPMVTSGAIGTTVVEIERSATCSWSRIRPRGGRHRRAADRRRTSGAARGHLRRRALRSPGRHRRPAGGYLALVVNHASAA